MAVVKMYQDQMFNELDTVTLTEPIPLESIFQVPDASPLLESDNQGDGLRPGDVGTIVHSYPEKDAFIVEFVEPGGYTVALVDVLPSQIRPATDEDLANDRFFQQTAV